MNANIVAEAPQWRVVYICSAARSGSTLTDMFLGGHSQAASLGEVNFLGKALALKQTCACGAGVCNCGQWTKVFEDLLASTGCDLREDPYAFRLWDMLDGIAVDRRKQTMAYKSAVYFGRAWLDLRHRTRNLLPMLPSQAAALRNKCLLFDSIARQWGKRVLIDSSKSVREAIELYRYIPGRVRIILLTRDGRGVFLSNRRSKMNRRESVAGWLKYYRRAIPLVQTQIGSSDLFTLRYEDLATEPEKLGKELCQFLDLPFEGRMLDLAATTRHIVDGNDTRFAASKGIKLDEKWRTQLTPGDLAHFNRFGLEMNKRLGYL